MKNFALLSAMAISLIAPSAIRADDVYDVFSDIYRRGEWGRNEHGDGISGVGSIYQNAKPYVDLLQQFIIERKIRSVVDVGCGDWELSKYIQWGSIEYSGFDVAKCVIEKDKEKYGKDNIHFYVADPCHSQLPVADLLVCKDVLQHLPNEFIQSLIPKLKNFKYCLITNDISAPGVSMNITNMDIRMGQGRFIDLSKAPFYVKGYKILNYTSPGTVKEVFLIVNENSI